MTATPGLNTYNEAAPKEFCFARFQWTLPGAVARGSQPHYSEIEKDQPHTLKPIEVRFLQLKNIVCVMSANHHMLSPDGIALLNNGGIDYHHVPVRDFGAPSPAELTQVADWIEGYRTRAVRPGATLVYCGYGQGRTGTYIAAWAMLRYLNDRTRANDMLTFASLSKEFGVETLQQVEAINDAAGGPYVAGAVPAPMPWPSLPPIGSQASAGFPFGGAANFNSGPSGVSMPSATTFRFYRSTY